ncbi:MAG: hypothetical protein J6Q58_00900 [Clostridia bacterium]|nr:hypothetical protein [Clostridia bacterium]
MELHNIDTFEIAGRLYELAKDMDWMDYDEEIEQIISEIEQCIYYIKTIASNEHNADYFRTFYNILQPLV